MKTYENTLTFEKLTNKRTKRTKTRKDEIRKNRKENKRFYLQSNKQLLSLSL